MHTCMHVCMYVCMHTCKYKGKRNNRAPPIDKYQRQVATHKGLYGHLRTNLMI